MRCGRLSEFDSTIVHWLRSSFFSSRRYVSAWVTVLSFGQRSTGSVFGKLVIDGEERAIGLEFDGIFFRLTVAEIANLPDRAGDLRGVDFIEARDADALAEEFVYERIGNVGENDGAAIGIWIQACLRMTSSARAWTVFGLTDNFR